MPSASERMATSVNPGFARSMRAAYRMSRAIWSINVTPRVSRQASFCWSSPPIAITARRRASSGVTPRETCASICHARWNCSSSSSSASTRLDATSDRHRSANLVIQRPMSHLFQSDNRGDRGGEAFPVGGFTFQLLTTRSRQFVELRTATQLAGLPLRLDPTLLFQLVEGGIQGTIADLQFLARHLLESLAHRPPVQWLECQDFQQEQIERALDEIGWLTHQCCPRLPMTTIQLLDAVETDRAADGISRAAETPLPEGVTDHRNRAVRSAAGP